MKYSFTFLALAAIVSITSAQTVPSCAQPCIDAAVKAVTTCGAKDIACQCESANQSAIQAKATSCVLSSCSSTDAAATLSAAQAICAALPAGGASSTSEAASTSKAPSTSAAAPASTSAKASATSSEAATTLATVASTSTVATTSTPASNGTATSVAPAKFTGAASQLAAGLGSVFIVGMAALAAL